MVKFLLKRYFEKIKGLISGNKMQKKRVPDYRDSSIMKDLDTLKMEWDFYQEKRNELFKKHENMYVAIKGKKILGVEEKLSELEKIVYAKYPELEYEPVLFQKIEKDLTVYYMRKPRF